MRAVTAMVIVSLCMLSSCDWFNEPVQHNLPPSTELIICPSREGVDEGDDVHFEWTGNDYDGHVEGFEWCFDSDSVWVRTKETHTIVENITVGDHSFKVRSVDDDGDVDPYPAQCLFAATVAGSTVARVVLVELFTTTWCKYCPNAEAALNALLDEFGSHHLCVVAYHGTPAQDGLATSETAARIDWYTTDPRFPGEPSVFPTAVFDGQRIVDVAETVDNAKSDYRYEINLRREVGAPVKINLTGELGSSEGTVAAKIKAEGWLPSNPRVLRFAVIEDNVKYNGVWTNRFDFVVRDLLEDEQLGISAIGDSVTVTRDFSIDQSWVLDNLDVIVFVQDMATMEVIQAGRLGNQ